MGVVYEAYDHDRETIVALKTLRNFDAQSVYRFKNEFRQLADLEHPNLVRLGELHCEDGLWFFTMEYVDGETFLRWVRPDGLAPPELPTGADTVVDSLPTGHVAPATTPSGGFDEARLRRSLSQLATAVSFLHTQNKVHRDIKPSNILVTRDARTVLLDFGLVADANKNETRDRTDSQLSGTATYMAPEQAAAKPCGPPADWYSVGCVLYEAMTRRCPFDGPAIEVLIDKQRSQPPAPRELVREVPDDLNSLCVDLLRTDPRARPTAQEVLVRLGVVEPQRASRVNMPAVDAAAAAPFVGRDKELAILGEAFFDSQRGRAVSQLVVGESGQGKSALVRRFLEVLEAKDRKAVVLQGRCYEREAVPYKAFDRIIDALSRHLFRLDPVDAALMVTRDVALLARLFPVLKRVEAIARLPEPRESLQSPQELRRRAFSALREIFARIAERQPLVLSIDDFQWADADSLTLLAEVMHEPHAPPLLLLATVRTGGEAQPVSTLTTAAGLSEVRELPLPRLSADAARTLARTLLGAAGNDASSALIAEEAEGHPLFIFELAQHVGASGEHTQKKVDLNEVLSERAGRLEEPARHLLEVVVVAGAPIPLRVATHAAALEPAEGARRADALRTANLVRLSTETIEPYHDRVREALLTRIDEKVRRERHRALALALESAGAATTAPQALVRHLEAAGDRARAAEQAQRAARMARDAFAFDRAAELYAAAIRLGEHEPAALRELRIEHGEALVNAGRGPEAADTFLLAADGADAATRLDCRRRAAEQLLICGHIERGLEVIRVVLGEIGVVLPATPKRALLSVLWNRARLKLRGLGWREKDPGDIALADLERVDIHRAVAIGLALVDNIRGADFQTRGLLLALKTGEARRIGMLLGSEAVFRATQGRKNLPKAQSLLDEMHRLAERTGDKTLRAFSISCAGAVCYLGGRFAEARDRVIVGEQALREETTGTTWELDSARIFLLLALRQMGSLAELTRRFDDYQRDGAKRGDRYIETTLTRAFNIIWLVRDDPATAERELDRKHWTPPEGGYHLQHWYELRARTELALYRGDITEARTHLAEGFEAAERSMLLRIQTVRTETAWMRGRLELARAATAGQPEPLLAEVTKLAKGLESERMPYATVWALLLRAAVASQKGESPTALLDQSIKLADEQQMMLCAAVARRRRGGVSEGDEWMNEMGIRQFERMTEVIAPGFRKKEG
jgi:hypothetical protein